MSEETKFDRDFAEWMEDPEFAAGYAESRALIDAIDQTVTVDEWISPIGPDAWFLTPKEQADLDRCYPDEAEGQKEIVRQTLEGEAT